MMLALLKKDLLLNRVTIAGNAIAAAAIYVIALIVTSTERAPVTIRRFLEAIGSGAIVAIILTCAMMTVYAGCIFAQERRERSANFLAMMPIGRRPILISKLIATWSIVLAFVLLHSIVLLFAATFARPGRGQFDNPNEVVDFVQTIILGGSITVMAFGVAWMCSTILDSPTVAGGISFGATLGLNVMIALIIANSDWSATSIESLQWFLCSAFSVVVGIGTFILGTIHYLKRIEP